MGGSEGSTNCNTNSTVVTTSQHSRTFHGIKEFFHHCLILFLTLSHTLLLIIYAYLSIYIHFYLPMFMNGWMSKTRNDMCQFKQKIWGLQKKEISLQCNFSLYSLYQKSACNILWNRIIKSIAIYQQSWSFLTLCWISIIIYVLFMF